MISATLIQALLLFLDPVTPDDVAQGRLTADDRLIVDFLGEQTKRDCGDQANVSCWERAKIAATQVVNAGRDLKRQHSLPISSALIRRCERVAAIPAGLSVIALAECYVSTASAPTSARMRMAGLGRLGRTQRGFLAIQFGMERSEVEFVLGGPGELSSATGGPGPNFTIYNWAAGNYGVLTASFKDGILISKAQVGLPR